MTNIIKQGSSLVIKGDANSYPFKDGKISLPLNSLYFVIDESNVVSFKQVNDNNTLLSVNINDLQINGEPATKENLIEKFDAVANGSMGGSKLNAGTNITLQPQEDGSITISATGELTQSVEWTDVLNKPSDIVNITDKLAEKLDKTVYEADKSTFALKSEIPSIDNLATKEELSTKQDVLVSGTNIKTINGETLLGNGDIVIEGGTGDVTKQYVDEQLALKADKTAIADMLTKTEASNTYATKEEIPSLENYLTIAQGDEKYQVKGNYITSELAEETYAKKTDIPDTSNFATKEELEAKADVTALASKQDTLVSGVNIKTINGQTLLGEGNIEIQGGSGSGIPDAPSDDKLYGRKNGNWSEVIIPSTDNFATKQEISDMLTKSEAASTYQPKGEYLTSIPEEYVTDSELSAKGYATTSQLNSKADKTELEKYVTTETAEATYAKKSEIPEEYTLPIATAEALGGIKVGAGLSINPGTGVLSATGGGTADSVDWANVTSKPDDIVNITDKLAEKLDVSTYNSEKATFALKSELADKANTSDLSNYLTTSNAETTYAKKSEIPSLEGYLKASTADEKYATKTELSGKADKTAIADMLTKTEASETYQPKGEYLTSVPAEYITESELNAKGYKKIEYLTQTQYDELPTKEEGVMYVITDAPEVVIPDTSTFATKEEIADMATKTWVGEQGFLTSHQDISNLATKQEVTEGLATKQDKGNYITVETADGKYQVKGDYATKAELANKVDTSVYTEDKATFALKSELTDFITASVDNLVNYYKKSETYTKGEVDGKISAITTINFEVVAELPDSGEANKIYLVPNEEQSEQNVKDEYIWVDGKWEIIGSTKVDLSNYYNKGEVDGLVNAKLDTATYNVDKPTFALKSELTNLATKAELADKANTSDLSNYLTTTDAESNYAKKSEIPSLEGYLQTSVADEKYATKTELSGKADKTAIADMLTKTEAASTYQPKGEYATTSQLSTKQDTLVSGTNIKTINGESILGSGDIVIEGGGDVTRQYVDEQLALKADKTSVPTVQAIPNGQETNYIYSKGFMSGNVRNVISKIDIDSNSTDLTINYNLWGFDTILAKKIRNASTSKSGAMSVTDKQKLDSINVEEMLTKTEASETYQPKGEYATTTQLSDYYSKTQSDGKYQVKGDYLTTNDVVYASSSITEDDAISNKIFVITGSTYAGSMEAQIQDDKDVYIGNTGILYQIYKKDTLTKTEASETYALQTALQEALDRISALEAQIGVLSTQLDNINGEIIN